MADLEYPVLDVEDLPEGTMRQVRAGELDILVANCDGALFAVGAHCPHYGANLQEGLLCDQRLTCPWHKAAFDISTGKAIDPPALDDLPTYAVHIEEDKIVVAVPDTVRNPSTPCRIKKADPHFVVLGAGAAGISAVRALREFGFDGRISLITNEPGKPYDRTTLSKDFLAGQAKEPDIAIRPDTFYSDLAIEQVTGQVGEVAIRRRLVDFEDGRTLEFDSLLIATGGIPRSLELPGAGLGNIFVLRTLADAKRIEQALRPGVRAVVIGGSFISLEVASCFARRKIPAMVIVPEKAPFAHTFGAEIGRALGQWHESHGVEFRLGLSVERIAGTGMAREVVLQSGERIPADVIVVGGGVRPATDLLHGIPLLEDGSVEVNEYLLLAPGVYAAGDIATFPDRYSAKPVRIEHWRVAEQHGRTAAANMLGRQQPFTGVPYFWTNHFDTRFDYVGHADRWDDIIVDGDLSKREFIAYYVSDGKLLAASACGRDKEIAALEQRFLQNRVPSASELKKGMSPLDDFRCSNRVATA